MKKQFLIFLSVILLVCTLDSVAQYTPGHMTISTPSGKTTIQTLEYSPWMRMTYGKKSPITKFTYEFKIVLSNDSVVQAKATLDINDSINTLQWGKKNNKTVVIPKDTKEIYRTDSYYVNGIPRDSCWIFFVGGRKIKTYSIIPELTDPVIQYIQKGDDGPILDLNKDNLLLMVAGDKKAIELIEKGKLTKAITLFNKD